MNGGSRRTEYDGWEQALQAGITLFAARTAHFAAGAARGWKSCGLNLAVLSPTFGYEETASSRPYAP